MKDGLQGKFLLAVAAMGLALFAARYLPARKSQPIDQPAPMAAAPDDLPGLRPGRGVVAHSVRTESGNTILEFGSDGIRNSP